MSNHSEFGKKTTLLIALETTATGFAESVSPRAPTGFFTITRRRHISSACPIQHAEILQPPRFDTATCDDITLAIAAFPPQEQFTQISQPAELAMPLLHSLAVNILSLATA